MCTAFFTLWELACPLQQKDKNASSGIFLFYRSNLQFPKRLWVVHFFSARQYAFLPIFSPPHEDFDPSLPFGKKTPIQKIQILKVATIAISKLFRPQKAPRLRKVYPVIISLWICSKEHNPTDHSIFKFDNCLGYSGEGPKRYWSKTEKMFNFACYNPRSLTKERLEYLDSLGIDVLGLTEL